MQEKRSFYIVAALLVGSEGIVDPGFGIKFIIQKPRIVLHLQYKKNTINNQL